MKRMQLVLSNQHQGAANNPLCPPYFKGGDLMKGLILGGRFKERSYCKGGETLIFESEPCRKNSKS